MKSEGLTEGEDAAKLSDSMEEACSSEPAFWKEDGKQPILRSLYFEGKRRREKYALSK